jgi:formylglycine-generating enzyme required for sulfatase activity
MIVVNQARKFAKKWLLSVLILVCGVGLGGLFYVYKKPPNTSDRAHDEQARVVDDRGVLEGAVQQPTKAKPSLPPAQPGGEAEGMVWIPGGTFWMGGAGLEAPDSLPVHAISLNGFWIDRTEVTNEQFTAFVSETGYQTIAERIPDARDFPGAPPENLVAGSVCFRPPNHDVPLNDHFQWWSYVPGANWRHPDGPQSSLEGKEKHPVVHVAWDDAVAYARWAKKRLPTEAEWELAARGGLDRKRYTWGDELVPQGKWMVNNWQGKFPIQNTQVDGFPTTAPVGSFAANGYGLFDMAGNVWEWCADWYRPDSYASGPKANPKGPPDSFDPSEPGVPKRVQRGGSFLCSDLYCTRYLPGARGKGEPSSGASHLGFRCVKDPEPAKSQ